jgi:hypothetical protein
MSHMKPRHSFASVVLPIFAFICAIFIGTVAQGGPPSGYIRSNHHFAPGRLIVNRAPNFGWNIGVHLQIDGRDVADIVKYRHYDGFVSAGPHVLTVRPVPVISVYGYSQPTSTTVNIQPGAEHLFVATWDSGVAYLHPNGVLLTPGAFWQNHGDGYP